MKSARSFQTITRLLTSGSLPVVLALVAVALALPALWTGWQQDDLMHRYFLLGNPTVTGVGSSPLDLFYFLDGDSSHTQALMDVGVIPWWTLKELRLSFWRPLSSITHWLDYRLWPASGVGMHLQSLLWFGSLVIAVALLYRRFLGPTWIAGLAALFFAVDDGHGLAAGWLSNRNALIAGLFGVLALLAHDRWRRENWSPGRFVGPLFLLLGLLAGESALAVCGYLFAYALFMDAGRGRARAVTLLPYALVSAAWLIAYAQLGRGTWGSGFYTDPFSEPVRFLGAVMWKAPLLLADQWGLPPSSFTMFLPGPVITILLVWALLLLTLVAAMIIPLIRRDRIARFWAVGMLLAIPPVCSTMPHGRLLLFAGIGAFGLLAQWIAGVWEKSAWVPQTKWWTGGARPALAFFLLVHIVVAPILLPFNAKSASFAQAYIQDAAAKVSADKEFGEQNLVILSHPIVFYAHYFQTARILAGQPAPRRVRVLAPGDVPLHLYRPDEHTLIVRPEGGYIGAPFDNVFRGPTHPLRRGDEVTMAGMNVEVLENTEDGRPALAAFRFPVSLEDASLRWLRWEQGGYVHYVLPAVGDSGVVPASPLVF